MAIRVRDTISGNNRIVIDDGKNFFVNDLTFTDNSSVSSLGLAPGTLKWTLDNPNAFDLSGLSDEFGQAIAASDQYLIVGTWREDDTGGSNSGRAYIYDVTTGALVWTLKDPDGFSNNFGKSVAISGNYVIVGSDLNSGGKAYIFDVRTGTFVWTLNDPNPYGTVVSDYFGIRVAISDNYAIVSASNEDDAGGLDSGKAYIFNVTTGQLLYTLDNPNAYSTSDNDNFGLSVAISGNYAIVGAYNEDDAVSTSSGKAYIYNVTTGALVHTLNNPDVYVNGSGGDWFGFSVGISGNYAIVGANGEDASSNFWVGKAYIYNVTTGTLVWTLDNPSAYSTINGDEFGRSVAISGNYAIVGAEFEDDSGGTSSGKAYIFNVTTGALIASLDNPYSYDRTSGDRFGYSVAINSSMAFVGAPYVNSAQGLDSGAVYSFNLNNFAPMYTFTNPVNNYDGSSSGSSDLFRTVAISGNYAIVGAVNEDDFAGNQSGKAYIFNVSTGQLIWTLNNPNVFNTSLNDQFGISVAISGNYAIVGAYVEDDAGGADSGKAYVYNVTTGQLVWALNNPNAYSTSAGDRFGTSVAISGNFAIVGAPYEDDAAGNDSGKAYIFNVTTGALVHTLNNPNTYSTSLNELYAASVEISNNFAIVSGHGEDEPGENFSSGKAYIYNVTTGALLYTLNNPNAYSTSSGDQFGLPCAISGNFAIFGAYAEDDAGGAGSGKAYVYNVTTGQLVHTLNNPNAYSTSQGDQFGISVAISGNYAIVGAQAEDDAGGAGSGKAYVYNVTTGALLYTLNNPNAYSTSAGDYFGNCVAIDGIFAIVGASEEDDAGGTTSGKAYIFNLASPQSYTGFTSLSGLEKLADQNTIVDRSYLKWTLNNPNAYNTSDNDNFGYSVAISGNYAIVGAYQEDDAGGTTSGKAYIFNVTTGQLLWTLNNPNAYSTSAGDYFGNCVAIDGIFAIVGASEEDDAGGTTSGKAYVYNVTTGALVHTLNNPNAYSISDGDRFGRSISISGNFAILGVADEDDAGGTLSGKAYIYNVTTGALVHTLDNPNAYSTSFYDAFGWAVGISGNFAVVSAFYEDDAGGIESGKAYIFNVTTGALVHTLNNPNAYSTSVNDFFGISVAISGNYAIVGAYYEDDAGGTASGKAYIYNVTTGQLLWTLNNPNTYGASANDNFGRSVAISGNYAIVGAPNEDDVLGTDSGKAYIFNVTTGSLVLTIDNPNPFGATSFGYFGESVAISGNYVIVGTSQEELSSGKAYIFSINNLNYKSLEDKLISLFHY